MSADGANALRHRASRPFGTESDAPVGGDDDERFTTYKRSLVTGLDYAVNRFYSPELARFTQVDPIGASSFRVGDSQSQNGYSYVSNDPVNKIDPVGLLQQWYWRYCFDDGREPPCGSWNWFATTGAGDASSGGIEPIDINSSSAGHGIETSAETVASQDSKPPCGPLFAMAGGRSPDPWPGRTTPVDRFIEQLWNKANRTLSLRDAARTLGQDFKWDLEHLKLLIKATETGLNRGIADVREITRPVIMEAQSFLVNAGVGLETFLGAVGGLVIFNPYLYSDDPFKSPADSSGATRASVPPKLNGKCPA